MRSMVEGARGNGQTSNLSHKGRGFEGAHSPRQKRRLIHPARKSELL